ncbi:MAG: hypothetical protein IGS03_11500 [Candidatus Sericytochromatia bacterium]|nr:hypothetical protein [Candidatus Sericytochromatia bacterium]
MLRLMLCSRFVCALATATSTVLAEEAACRQLVLEGRQQLQHLQQAQHPASQRLS